MLIRAWRFLTMLLAALLMGMTFAHVLELPAKMEYPPDLYLSIHRTLYLAFGVPNIGAFVEIGAVLATIVLALLVRWRRPAFRRTLAAAICIALGVLVYFLMVEPANVVLRGMPIEAPPYNFSVWRERWEYGHVVRFVLHLVSFSLLVLSLLSSRIGDGDWSAKGSSASITPTRDRARQWHRTYD